jgi:BirA family biotin operon repressor/biotin-[acetyl-CoA-carboxylase] ligase
VTDLAGRGHYREGVERAPIDAAAVRAAAGERWSRIEVVTETGSTNADLLADPDAPHRALLVAESQVAGRGRLDRAWVSPPRAGLTFSVLLRPPVAIARWGWLPLLAGVALHDAVLRVSGVAVAVKWPNDLLAGERKLAGILAQTSGDAVVLGIGLNVSSAADELPPQSPGSMPPTSLLLSDARSLDRTELLVATLAELDGRLGQWAGADGDAERAGLAAAYRERCATLGRQVAVSATDGRRLRGTAAAIDAAGRLVLHTAAGPTVIGAGDVQHLRPA